MEKNCQSLCGLNKLNDSEATKQYMLDINPLPDGPFASPPPLIQQPQVLDLGKWAIIVEQGQF